MPRKTLIAAGTAIAGLGALIDARYRSNLDRARARVAKGSRIATLRCGPIEYAERGQGPPVLLAHGAGGGFDQGLELGQELARAGFRVIAPSRFGYLGTPLPADASAEAQADAHACLLDALQVPRAAIVGVSAGGPSALQFALRFPMRTKALVLVVPAAYAPPPNPVNAALGSRPMRVLLDTALRSDFLYWAAGKVADGAFMSAVLGTPRELLAKAPAQERARLRAFVEHVLPVSARRLGLRNDARIVLSLARYDLEAIAAPTLAISAADDLYGTFEGARYTAQHVPDGHFIGYPSGGHMLVGRNAAVAAAIDAFLRARDPGRLARPAP